MQFIAHTGKHTTEFREMGLVDLFLPALKAKRTSVRRRALTILADLVDENEAQSLEANSNAIANLVGILKSTVDSTEVRTVGEWSPTDITHGNFIRFYHMIRPFIKRFHTFSNKTHIILILQNTIYNSFELLYL